MAEKKFEVKKENLSQMKDFISSWCEENIASVKTSTKLAICSDEVISNILFYSKASLLSIECSKIDSEISIIFTDDGIDFNPLENNQSPDITSDINERQIGGLGIFMVKKIMNSVVYNRRENANSLKISISDEKQS